MKHDVAMKLYVQNYAAKFVLKCKIIKIVTLKGVCNVFMIKAALVKACAFQNLRQFLERVF